MMENNKYFEELSRILCQYDIESVPAEDGRLVILLNGKSVGRIEPGGIRCIAPGEKVNCPEGAREATLGCLMTPEASEAFYKAVPYAEMVAEYMGELKRAPLLKADGLDEGYRLLAEFHGTVLAGKEMDSGYGMQFVAWDWNYDRSSVEQGHYYHDNYEDAKCDFAERSGLVQKGCCFSDEQFTEMYRCMQDTLDDFYELTDSQEKIIHGASNQIECAVPNIAELVLRAEELYKTYEQTIQVHRTVLITF